MYKVENTEKTGHTVKPRLPGKMCTLTSVVQSQHAISQTRLQRKRRSVYHVPVLVNTIRPSGLVGVFIQRTDGVCVLQNTQVDLELELDSSVNTARSVD